MRPILPKSSLPLGVVNFGIRSTNHPKKSDGPIQVVMVVERPCITSPLSCKNGFYRFARFLADQHRSDTSQERLGCRVRPLRHLWQNPLEYLMLVGGSVGYLLSGNISRIVTKNSETFLVCASPVVGILLNLPCGGNERRCKRNALGIGRTRVVIEALGVALPAGSCRSSMFFLQRRSHSQRPAGRERTACPIAFFKNLGTAQLLPLDLAAFCFSRLFRSSEVYAVCNCLLVFVIQDYRSVLKKMNLLVLIYLVKNARRCDFCITNPLILVVLGFKIDVLCLRVLRFERFLLISSTMKAPSASEPSAC